MVKRKKTYIIILISLFIIYIGAELFRPKKIDWSLSFSNNSKIPFGCYILRQKLNEFVSVVSVSENSTDLYQTLNKSEQNSTLCIITDQFKPDESDSKALLQYVKKGNYAFIAAQNFEGLLKDSLNLESTYKISESVDATNKLKLQIVNPYIPKPRSFSFIKISPYFFTRVDTANTTILEKDSLKRVTYIRTKYGKGFFFLHANPLVFTNYHILYNSWEYPSRSLAYLANRPLIWDEYYKPANIKEEGKSPMRYIFSQVSLRYAYILFVLTWLIFVCFGGKRKQKMVPVYEKPKNQSLEFIETVSQLYFNQRNNKDIIHKKIAYFAEYVHSVFYLKFQPEDKAFRKDFAGKANISIVRVNKLFDILIKLQQTEKISDLQLMQFIKEIDSFQYPNQRLTQK